ncbi:MAG: TonB-dependent receptor, partial [Acidobacteria bacterium]|nr:TonB-dependent receptor [Acidobacteriota bacterium]
MQLGSTQETVTVEAAPVTVQSDTNEISSVITGTQITQLESNGRSLYSLVNLTPGVVSNQVDFQIPTPMGGDQNLSFNGQRIAHTLYMIDGAEAADRGGSGAIVMPSQDSLAEFRVLSSNYSSEYGLVSGSTVSTVIKSGTSQLHSSAWWFGRNDFLDARPYFTPRQNASGTLNPIPELRFNLWGFNVGGPVTLHPHGSQHKTFFFYNMEWRRLITSGTLNVGVPFSGTYGGNLNQAISFNGGSLLNTGQKSLHAPYQCQVSTAVQNAFASAGQALSGCTGGAPDTTKIQPFVFQGVQNVINPALLDPNAQALLKAGIFPSPVTGNTFIGGPKAPTNVKEEIARLDHTFNSKFSVYGHWISEQILQTDIPARWSGDNLPTVGDTFANPSYSAVVHAVHTIRPNLLNEMAFNYDGNRINILPIGIFQLSQASGFAQHRYFPTPTNILPIIALSGKSGTQFNANWSPWINSANDYQVRDDLSWTKGAHQFKMGGSWANFRKLQPLQVSTQGNFSFGGAFTGYDFADFLLGMASGYNEAALKDSRHWNSVSWAAYFQDDWRATKRLTLNLGLRWDGIPHTAEVNGQMSNFYPNLYNPANAAVFANANGTQICSGANVPLGSGCTAASPGLAPSPNPVLAGLLFYANGLGVPGKTPGVTNGLVNNYWNNWGPRVGFAYDLTGRGKTIVRAGFGTFFERVQGNDMYQAGGNNLFGGQPSVTNVSLSDPHVGVDQNNVNISAAILPVTVNGITELNKTAYKNPTSYQFSGGVQQQLGTRTVLAVSYVGNQGRYESYRQEINLPALSVVPTLFDPSTGKYNGKANLVKPFRGYSSINVEQDGQNSHYNSLQVSLASHLRDLQFNVGYTLSRAIDPSSNIGGDGNDLNNVTNPYAGWQFDVGPSVIDRTHVAYVNFIYDLPVFRRSSNRFAKDVLGGWQLSGIVNMMSGLPVNLGISAPNQICQAVPNCSLRPNSSGSIQYPKSAATLTSKNQTMQWFNPSTFSINTLGSNGVATWGNFGFDG